MAPGQELQTFWETSRQLIADGETETALDLAESFLKGRIHGIRTQRIQRLLDDLLMVRARSRRVLQMSRRGLITVDQENVESAKRDQATLSLLEEIEREVSQPPRLVASIDLPSNPTIERLMAPESHLRSVGWLAEGLRLASAVCRIAQGVNPIGSGFRCLGRAVLTNNHVIADAHSATGFQAEFFFEEDASHRLTEPVRVPLDPTYLFWTSTKLDITLVGIPEINRPDIAVIPVRKDISGSVGDRVSIIQHPNGGPKQIAITNNRVLNFYEDYVHYLTDTLPGSSGSPVFSDDWRLLAIHHAGGSMRKNPRGDLIFANEGILASAFFSDEGFNSAYQMS